tara:strand:+ start:113 stop:610 length:498 start_codon:yes stop_codon:yes gene_type:complete
MKKVLIILCFGLMQGIGSQSSDEAKAIYFQTERISPENALYYQLGCPLPFCNLGYAYSDNWKRGFKWDLAIIGTALFAASQDDDGGCDYDNWGNYYCDDDDDKMSTIAGLVAIGISIYKMIDVYKAAEQYNDNLYEKVFGSSRPYFSMDYSPKRGALLSMTIPIK